MQSVESNQAAARDERSCWGVNSPKVFTGRQLKCHRLASEDGLYIIITNKVFSMLSFTWKKQTDSLQSGTGICNYP